MGSLSVGPVTLEYDDMGEGNPPFLFVHGWAADRNTWAPQQTDLAPTFRCISVDLRGCGASTPVPPFDIVTQADDLAGLLDGLGVPPAIVCGHGHAGLIALALNARHPERVIGIATADTPLRPDWHLSPLAEELRRAGSAAPAAATFARLYPDGMPPVTRQYVENVLLKTPLDVAVGMIEPPADAPLDLLAALKLADTKPFMALWPAGIALGDIEWLRRELVFLRHEPIAGAGHFLTLDQPDITSALLRSFVLDVERDPRIDSMR